MVPSHRGYCLCVGRIHRGPASFPARVQPRSRYDECVLVQAISLRANEPCGLADYAVVIIMAVFVFASASWIVSARKWFKGPVTTVEDGEMSAYDEKQRATQ